MAEHGNIWVIDDDRSIRWVLEKAFSKADIEVRTFENGNRVLDALDQDQPDAILSDIRMPGIDGIALREMNDTRIINQSVAYTQDTGAGGTAKNLKSICQTHEGQIT